MPLYEWRSDMLREYRRGSILVVAENPDAARDIVRADLDGYLRVQHDYLYYDGKPSDEESCEDLNAYRAQFESDIRVDPIVHAGTVFIRGSE